MKRVNLEKNDLIYVEPWLATHQFCIFDSFDCFSMMKLAKRELANDMNNGDTSFRVATLTDYQGSNKKKQNFEGRSIQSKIMWILNG